MSLSLLRYTALFNSDSANIPPPTVALIQKLLDDSCPLTIPEINFCEKLYEKTPQIRVASNLGTAISMLEDFESQLDRMQRPSPHIESVNESYLGQGIVCFAVMSIENLVRVTISGTFGSHTETLPIRLQQLNTLAFDAVSALARPGSDCRTPCRSLYDLIIRPFRHLLDKHATRVVVMHSNTALRRIPLSVFHDGTCFLVEKFASVCHPGLTPLRAERGIRPQLRAASIAVTNAPSMRYIPGALRDTAVLESLISANHLGSTDKRIDCEATAAGIEAMWNAKPTLIHVSCHFETNSADASRSSFVLGDGSRYSLAQLARQDFSNVDIAIILGCESQAISEVGGQFGIGAIDTLLLRMGVGQVLGTAWPIEDVTAHNVFKAFLAGLFVDRLDSAEALRRAIISDGQWGEDGVRLSDPHEWGPFVLSGGWVGLH